MTLSALGKDNLSVLDIESLDLAEQAIRAVEKSRYSHHLLASVDRHSFTVVVIDTPVGRR